MTSLGLRLGAKNFMSLSWVYHRNFSRTAVNNATFMCKLLVIGGGSGGCTVAAKFAKKSNLKGTIIILEPCKDHYYQPLWTLVGAGVKKLANTRRDMKSVLPDRASWLQDEAVQIDPCNSKVFTKKGAEIRYEYLVISVGLKYDYHKVPGLKEALEDPKSMVSTIYDKRYAEKVWSDLQSFQRGEAIFTYPDSPIKCPGAPQKIAYLTDSYLTKKGIRQSSKITYNTCLPAIFGVKKYADALMKVIERKKICVNYKTVLQKVDAASKTVVFKMKDTGLTFEMKYDMLQATPPMSTPEFLQCSKDIVDQAGYLDVNKYTLQSTKYPNIFGIGDCTNTPNSKTAAAVAKQGYVLEKNLSAVMEGGSMKQSYNGYGACPLVTSYNTCILAEFLYDGVVHETFPFDQIFQSAESRIAYYMKRDLFPFIYWNFMLKGNYNGPEFVRRIVNPYAK